MGNHVVFPAEAGVNLYGAVDVIAGTSIPRGGGGEPCAYEELPEEGEYSPRRRG